jgi:hypothetical protein
MLLLVPPLYLRRRRVHLHRVLVERGLALVQLGYVGGLRAPRMLMGLLGTLVSLGRPPIGGRAPLTSSLRKLVRGRLLAHLSSVALLPPEILAPPEGRIRPA